MPSKVRICAVCCTYLKSHARICYHCLSKEVTDYIPTKEEIEAAALAIREQWTAEEAARRRSRIV